MEAEVIPTFDPLISPRNYVIAARRVLNPHNLYVAVQLERDREKREEKRERARERERALERKRE